MHIWIFIYDRNAYGANRAARVAVVVMERISIETGTSNLEVKLFLFMGLDIRWLINLPRFCELSRLNSSAKGLCY